MKTSAKLLIFPALAITIFTAKHLPAQETSVNEIHNQAHNQAMQSHTQATQAHNAAHSQAVQAHNDAHSQAIQNHNDAHNNAHNNSINNARDNESFLRNKAADLVMWRSQEIALNALLKSNKSSQEWIGKKFKEIPGNFPMVRYTGRVVKGHDGSVSFDWSGTYAELKFTGGFLAIRVSDSRKSYYNIFINGQRVSVVSTFGKDSVIVLAAGLKGRYNTAYIQKRSEGEQGKTTIHSFILAGKGDILGYNPGRTRHIEFIGNSLTVGFGTEGKSKDEKFKAETENCDLAFGAIISRYFDADYTLIAHSGWGAARNYGDSLRVSRISMKDKMLQTFDMEPVNAVAGQNVSVGQNTAGQNSTGHFESGQIWNFKDYRPDIVVINLGSNDFSTKPHPLKEEFLGCYSIIIDRLRDKYGDVPILCIAPNRGPAFEYLQEFVKVRADKKLFFTAYLQGVYNGDTDLGSVGHPNYSGQQKMAMTLIPYISTATGWPLTGKPVR